MVFKGEHGRNHDCKRPDPKYKTNLYQRIINLRESFMIRSTSCPWAWTQGSRSTPTSSMHNLSCTSGFWRSFSAEILSSKRQKSKTRENSWFTRIRGRHRFNPSGILVTYSTSFKSKYTSSKAEHGWPSKGYNLPKSIYTRGKAHEVIEYEGRCRMKSNNGSGDPRRSWSEYRYSIRGRKNARASDYRTSE